MVLYFGWPFGNAKEERRSCYSFFSFYCRELEEQGWGISLFSLAGLKVDKGKRRVKRKVACTLAVGFLSPLVSNLVFIFDLLRLYIKLVIMNLKVLIKKNLF